MGSRQAYPWTRKGVGGMASNPLGHIVGCRMSAGKQVYPREAVGCL